MLNDKVRPVQVDPIMLSRCGKDIPRDGGIPKIPAVDEGEAVDNTAHYDQPSVDAMDNLSLLSVRVYRVIVKSQTGRIRGDLMIESIPAVGAVVASFLVGFGVHDEKVTLSVPRSRHGVFWTYVAKTLSVETPQKPGGDMGSPSSPHFDAGCRPPLPSNNLGGHRPAGGCMGDRRR